MLQKTFYSIFQGPWLPKKRKNKSWGGRKKKVLHQWKVRPAEGTAHTDCPAFGLKLPAHGQWALVIIMVLSWGHGVLLRNDAWFMRPRVTETPARLLSTCAVDARMLAPLLKSRSATFYVCEEKQTLAPLRSFKPVQRSLVLRCMRPFQDRVHNPHHVKAPRRAASKPQCFMSTRHLPQRSPQDFCIVFEPTHETFLTSKKSRP